MKYKLNPNIPINIFRAYDIRGTIEDTLIPDNVYSIGLAIGSSAQIKNQMTIVVARDGRLSGPSLSAALIQGIMDSGCNVIDIGMVPTPLLYYATHILKTQSGVMLTGSHNPINYNGLKIVIAGETVSEAGITDLHRRIVTHDLLQGTGQYEQHDIVDRYIATITEKIKLARPLKIVLDCGSGIGGILAPRLYKALGCEVTELFCKVDGYFPHHHPDPSKPENLQDLIAKVKELKADIGLALDGDGDRLGLVTNTGDMIYPDRQLMLFAIDLLACNPGAIVIYDVKCSRHLEPIITKHGGKPLLWKTGHSLAKNKMRETGALLAGEMSGHFFFKERWFGFDDGLYSGARMLEILSKQTTTATQVFKSIPHDVSTPEIQLNMSDETKFAFVDKLIAQANFPNAKKIILDGLRIEFFDGWGLVRCSNTTPTLTLRFEADNLESLERIKILFKTEMKKLDSTLKLDF